MLTKTCHNISWALEGGFNAPILSDVHCCNIRKASRGRTMPQPASPHSAHHMGSATERPILQNMDRSSQGRALQLDVAWHNSSPSRLCKNIVQPKTTAPHGAITCMHASPGRPNADATASGSRNQLQPWHAGMSRARTHQRGQRRAQPPVRHGQRAWRAMQVGQGQVPCEVHISIKV